MIAWPLSLFLRTAIEDRGGFVFKTIGDAGPASQAAVDLLLTVASPLW